jgi:hypothetical protein
MPKALAIKSITRAVLILASMNLAWSFYQLHLEGVERQEAYERSGVWFCYLGPSPDVFARIYIELSLLVAFVGTWVKGFKGTLINLVGLTGATLFYVLWWQLYFKLVALSYPIELQFIRHRVYLFQANYLDLLIAAFIGLLISLQVRNALFSLFRPTKPCS